MVLLLDIDSPGSNSKINVKFIFHTAAQPLSLALPLHTRAEVEDGRPIM